MMLTNEQLEEITRLAAAAFTPKQVRFIMDLDVEEFFIALKDESSELATAYYKGLYSSEVAVRESVFLLARNGSSPAQTLALKYLSDTKNTIIKDGLTSEKI